MKPKHSKLISDALKLIAEAKGKLEDVSLDMHDKYDDGSDRWQDSEKACGIGWSISFLDDVIYNAIQYDVEEPLRSLLRTGWRD